MCSVFHPKRKYFKELPCLRCRVIQYNTMINMDFICMGDFHNLHQSLCYTYCISLSFVVQVEWNKMHRKNCNKICWVQKAFHSNDTTRIASASANNHGLENTSELSKMYLVGWPDACLSLVFVLVSYWSVRLNMMNMMENSGLRLLTTTAPTGEWLV